MQKKLPVVVFQLVAVPLNTNMIRNSTMRAPIPRVILFLAYNAKYIFSSTVFTERIIFYVIDIKVQVCSRGGRQSLRTYILEIPRQRFGT